MKQKLLLTSQGLPKELSDVFLSMLTKTPQKNNVSFITTAAYGEEVSPQWLDFYREQLHSYGIENVKDLDLRHKTKKELSDELSNKDIIFVNGGDTFFLLYWARKSGFDKLLSNFLEEGKIYIGVSAGSHIVCPTIEAAIWNHPERNKIGLKDLSGLNLVPFLIIVHFEEKNRSIVERTSRKTKYPVVALNDTQAVLVNDDNYKVVRKGRKEFFNDFEEKY